MPEPLIGQEQITIAGAENDPEEIGQRIPADGNGADGKGDGVDIGEGQDVSLLGLNRAGTARVSAPCLP